MAAPIEVFRADQQDAPGVAAVHVRAWEAAYRELFPAVADRGPSLDDRIDRWSELLGGDHEKAYTLIAERGGKVVGFCSLATPSRDGEPGERVAEIAAFYVDPPRWRSGIGTALVKKAFEELREERWQSVTLWVLAENAAARAFYAGLGFQHEGVEGPDQLTDRPKVRLRAKL